MLTGDRVLEVPGGSYAVKPGAGRTKLGFAEYQIDGHQYVVPSDAAALLGAGRVDRRLLDVTELLRLGYDDASRGDLPLIIEHGSGAQAAAAARLAVAGASTSARLPILHSISARVSKTTNSAAWSALTSGGPGPRALASGLTRIWLDGRRSLTLDQSAPQIGAPAAWRAGYTGAGVRVAVLDSGIAIAGSHRTPRC